MRSHPNTSHPFFSHRFSVKHLGALPTLASNRLLGFAASAAAGLFFAIFLYEFFDMSLQAVLLWYGAAYLIRVPIVVLAGKIFSRTGLVPSMIFGTFGLITFFVCAWFLDIDFPADERLLLGVAALGLAVMVGFYWSPFHVDFAEFTKKGKRGRQLALVLAGHEMIAIGAPVVGGFLIAQYSYSAIFIFAVIMLLLSLIPIHSLPHTHVTYEFGFFETFKKMFEKPYRAMSVTFMARGAENTVGVIVWPIFLFSVFDGEYLDVGIFAGIILMLSILLQIVIGQMVDKKKPRRILRFGTDFYALGWLAKALVDTVSGVFAASTFHGFGTIMMNTSLEAIYYETAADSGHYVDEFTVVRETAIAIGRVLMVALLLLVTFYFSFVGAFIAAAVVSLGINSFARYRK